MHDSGSITEDRAVLVDSLDRPISSNIVQPTVPTEAVLAASVHPLNNPDEWRREAMYVPPPSNIDIVQEQKWIDSLMGVTRNNESIYKLVWNGDRKYWHQFYMKWNVLGQPIEEPMRRPLIRYKVIRDADGQPVRDVFPPRWLILTRLEPEQYADTWKRESFVWDNGIRAMKQIRPDEPPKVFWLWYGTIAEHNSFCCAKRNRNFQHCFGDYAPPKAYRPILEQQHKADLAAGTRSVFEKIDSDFVADIMDQYTGYNAELRELEIEREIYMENPYALLGIHGSLAADADLPKARRMVKEFYDRQMQALSGKKA